MNSEETKQSNERYKEAIKGVIDTSIVADKAVRDIERIDYAIQNEIRKRGGKKAIHFGLAESIGIPQDVAIAAMYVWKQIGHFRYTDVSDKLTIRELTNIIEDIRCRFIQQHIINYAAHNVIIDFYDWLHDKNLIKRFSRTEAYYRKIESIFKEYEKTHFNGLERSTIYLFDDHMRLSFDNISPKIEDLEVAIRDYLIQKRTKMVAAGQIDDISTIQKVAVCLCFLTAMQHSFKDFFADIIHTYGVDFRSEFRYAELSKMARNFIFMCEAQDVKFCTDNKKDVNLLGVDIDNSVRVNAAWNAIVNTLGDTDLLDETAKHAIELNPEKKREYDKEMAQKMAEYEAIHDAQEKCEMENGFKVLEEKYKVIRVS